MSCLEMYGVIVSTSPNGGYTFGDTIFILESHSRTTTAYSILCEKGKFMKYLSILPIKTINHLLNCATVSKNYSYYFWKQLGIIEKFCYINCPHDIHCAVPKLQRISPEKNIFLFKISLFYTFP